MGKPKPALTEVGAGHQIVQQIVSLQPSPAATNVIKALRTVVPGVGPDRWLSPELEAATLLVQSGQIESAAREIVKVLR